MADTPVVVASLSNATYQGSAGHTPVKGVDYFTQSDINDIISQVSAGAEVASISNTDILNMFNELNGGN